jgi:hypothetical protein
MSLPGIFIILLILSSMEVRNESCYMQVLHSRTTQTVNSDMSNSKQMITGKQIISFQNTCYAGQEDHASSLYIDFKGVSHFTLDKSRDGERTPWINYPKYIGPA